MELHELHPGDRVLLPGTKGGATVVHVGACDYGSCRFGDNCVEVKPDAANRALNWKPEQLRPEPTR